MNRRDFLKGIGMGLGLTGGLGGLHGCLSKPRRRNVILITMDTTRKDHLGCYGYELPTSPNLDALAKECIVFDECYGTSVNTLCNHASILTSLYPYNHGVLGSPHRPLHPQITSLANILSKEGYKTVAITSVFFMNRYTIGNGFHEFDAPREAERSAEKTTDIAINRLDSMSPDSQGLFLWLHYYDPHYPYYPPEEYVEAFFKGEVSKGRLEFITKKYAMYGGIERCELENPEKISSKMELTEDDHEAIISMYDGEIAYMDRNLGRFMDALKKRDFYGDSIIVVTSDHGESLFENDSELLGHRLIYEPVVRIPLVVRNSDIQPRRIGGLVQNIDIVPTLLNWLDLEMAETDGEDLSPLILDNKAVRQEILLTEVARVIGIVTDKYKMRMVTARREKPLPVPQSWNDEAQRLPKIKFSPEPPPVWDYDTTKGVIFFSWQHPPECKAEIDRFVRQVVHEGMAGPDHVSTLEEVDEKTTDIIVPLVAPKRVWEKESVSLPAFMRIIARDREGRNVASSDIVELGLNSPLGIERELYELAADPDERRNIAQARPEIVENTESRLKDFGERTMKVTEDGPGILRGKGYQKAKMSSQDVEQLRALGYLH
jgi:arylsulfatase